MDPAAAPAPAVPDSPLADAVLARLTDLYAPAADPVRAEGAAAY
ncbi:DNA alkylation repair protein, partial [Streptomyces sp. SID8455]|nr:DNA alkylation repair protein [Streptomyces sp. SID8455]